MTTNIVTVSPAPLIYVAGAYNGDTPEEIRANIARAEKVSIALIRNGWVVFTPHKNTAGYEKYEDETLLHSTWISMAISILSRCDGLYVIDNWENSPGTKTEIRYAALNNMPTAYEAVCAPEDFTIAYAIENKEW